jgi:protocatechuate 3,4-dioxygenase beta subunit
MRPALFLFFLVAASLYAQQASAEGVVMDHSTGQPLRGVHVRMLAADFANGAGIEAVYGAASDAAGHFSVESLKPGLYIVMAERAGFVQVASSPASPLAFGILALKAGQHPTGYKVEMTPRALIAGRVVDEYGDPVDNVFVELQAVPPDHLQETPLGRSSAATDDRGEFHLLTAPGKYYVRASPPNRRGGPPEIRTDGTSAAPFANTYYPSATNTGAASPVQVAAGQDLAGIEIRLTRSAAGASGRGFTVSGVVTGAPASAQAMVALRFGETAGQLYNSRSATAGPDGKFSFTGMQPGFYSAMAIYASGKTSLQSRLVEFHLAADETSLQLVLAPGEDLAGTLELVGDAPAGESAKRTVRLESADQFNVMGQAVPPAVEVGKDGGFRIANVPPGKFKPVVEPMPENAYVKAVVLDGKPAPEAVLDLSQGAGGSRLKITVSRAGGQIAGRILDKDGDPVAGLAEVFLVTDVKQMQDGDADRVTDGKYSFKAIRPGKYRLYALDVAELIQSFAGGDEDEIMKSFFNAAEEIEIKEGDRITKDITAITKLPEKK